MSHTLHLASQGQQVGQLGFDAQRNHYSFRYHRAWQDGANAFYVAPALPFIAAEHLEPVRRMITDEELNERICRRDARTPPKQVAREIIRMARATAKLAPMQAALGVYIGAEVDLVRQISAYFCAQARDLLDIADQIVKVDVRC